MMKETIQRLLREQMHLTSPLCTFEKLYGGASTRTYFRITLENHHTFIAMQLSKEASSASDEITNFSGPHRELPFINIARFLSQCRIPIPTIYHYSEPHRLMILEDLGDEIMAAFVTDAPLSAQRKWYTKALDLLVLLQHATTQQTYTDCVAFQRSFDERLLAWEFDHFLEYGLQKRGIAIAPQDIDLFSRETKEIAKEITAFPFGFTHRDFQSRNLMVRKGELTLIDFQDALLGPVVYDLVALTRDSYVVLPPPLLQELIAVYAAKTSRDLHTVQREYCLVTIQRKLKDAGRFVYIDQVRKNSDFLQFIPTSLGYVREAFEGLTAHRELYAMLQKYIPEWK